MGQDWFVRCGVGFPYETEDDIQRTVRYLDSNKSLISGIFVLPFTMYDNSVMFKSPRKYGLEIVNEERVREKVISRFGKDVDVYRKINYRNMPFNEIDKELNWREKQKQIKKDYKVLLRLHSK